MSARVITDDVRVAFEVVLSRVHVLPVRVRLGQRAMQRLLQAATVIST